jgi:hypothetical protein
MKKIIFLLALTACSTPEYSQPDLVPLPTTGIQIDNTAKNTVVINAVTTYPPISFPEPMDPTVPLTPTEKDYLTDVRSRVTTSASNEEVIAWSRTWCDFMTRGMGRMNITSWIQEISSTDEEAWAWLVSAEASTRFFCKDQAYKWNP